MPRFEERNWRANPDAHGGRASRRGFSSRAFLPDADPPKPRRRLGAVPLAVARWISIAVARGGLSLSKVRSFARGALVGLVFSPLTAFVLYLFLTPAFDVVSERASLRHGGMTPSRSCGHAL